MNTAQQHSGKQISLPVIDLIGVGEVLAGQLNSVGIYTVGELASTDLQFVIEPIPSDTLRQLQAKARLIAGLRPWLEPFQNLLHQSVSTFLAKTPEEVTSLADNPAVSSTMSAYLQNQLVLLGAALQKSAMDTTTLAQLQQPASTYTPFDVTSWNRPMPTEPYVLHVDPQTGNDANRGDAEYPIASLHEAGKRSSTQTLEVIVELSAGTHVLFDHAAADNNERTLYHGHKRVRILGKTRKVGQSITVTAVADNVFSIAETLIPNAHIGQFIEIEIWPNWPKQKRWVIANTENTLTLAASVKSFGGSIELPSSGTFEIQELATTIVSSQEQAANYINRFFYQGSIEIENLHFDQTVNGGFAGLSAFSNRSYLNISACKFTGWQQCLNTSGKSEVNSCWFEGDGSGYGYGSFNEGFISGDSVFKDLDLAIKTTGVFVLGAANVTWILGCGLYVESDGAAISDFSSRLWVDPGSKHSLPNYIRMDGRNSHYSKLNGALTGITNHDSLGCVYQSVGGHTGWNFLNSSAASINAADAYIKTEDQALSLEDYRSGTTFGKALRYNDDRGNFFSD